MAACQLCKAHIIATGHKSRLLCTLTYHKRLADWYSERLTYMLIPEFFVQVAYMMDALRYREGALGAIWITLGLVNLSMLISEASFGGPSPLILSAAVSLCSGSTLFLIGASTSWTSRAAQKQFPQESFVYHYKLSDHE